MPHFFTLVCFLLAILLFEMANKSSVEALSSVPKHEKSVM